MTYEEAGEMTKMPIVQSQAQIQQTFDWINNRLDVAHNYPSGDLELCKGDHDFPCRLADLAEIAQIRLLGHLTVATTREASKSYCAIREIYQELFGIRREEI